MERITLFIRTSKDEGDVHVRFRLRDTGGVQLYFKSGLKANLKDLAKFELDGTVKSRVKVHNIWLKTEIDRIMSAMSQAYTSLCERMAPTHITSDLFEKEVKALLETPVVATEIKEPMMDRYDRFVAGGFRDNLFNEKRMKSYQCVGESIRRFMKIRHLEKISADEFTADMLKDLYEFFADEYKYVDKHKRLFRGMSERNIPKARREQNTVVTRMNKVQAFFNELLEQEEIEVSPFAKLGRKRKANMMRERYDDPRFLHKDELLRLIDAQVPDSLAETRDAFVLQCAFGCRISDFIKLRMDKIAVTEDGIPYIHYLPQKTMRENIRKEEIRTPILRYALDIIKKWQFNFPILRYVSGKSGYNVKIKELLKHCGIDREVDEFDESLGENVRHPIWEYGSSKICRSTHVDMMRKVQVDLYAAGLHSRGSEAVHRYTKEDLRDRFALMCVAFGQPLYKVDKDLNIIE